MRTSSLLAVLLALVPACDDAPDTCGNGALESHEPCDLSAPDNYGYCDDSCRIPAFVFAVSASAPTTLAGADFRCDIASAYADGSPPLETTLPLVPYLAYIGDGLMTRISNVGRPYSSSCGTPLTFAPPALELSPPDSVDFSSICRSNGDHLIDKGTKPHGFWLALCAADDATAPMRLPDGSVETRSCNDSGYFICVAQE